MSKESGRPQQCVNGQKLLLILLVSEQPEQKLFQHLPRIHIVP
jgi:hypothetical protein